MTNKDGIPLKSTVHPYMGKKPQWFWGSISWIRLWIFRPKLTESNLGSMTELIREQRPVANTEIELISEIVGTDFLFKKLNQTKKKADPLTLEEQQLINKVGMLMIVLGQKIGEDKIETMYKILEDNTLQR